MSDVTAIVSGASTRTIKSTTVSEVELRICGVLSRKSSISPDQRERLADLLEEISNTPEPSAASEDSFGDDDLDSELSDFQEPYWKQLDRAIDVAMSVRSGERITFSTFWVVKGQTFEFKQEGFSPAVIEAADLHQEILDLLIRIEEPTKDSIFPERWDGSCSEHALDGCIKCAGNKPWFRLKSDESLFLRVSDMPKRLQLDILRDIWLKPPADRGAFSVHRDYARNSIWLMFHSWPIASCCYDDMQTDEKRKKRAARKKAITEHERLRRERGRLLSSYPSGYAWRIIHGLVEKPISSN